MKNNLKFIIKIFLFILPIVLFWGFSFLILIRTGEFVSEEEVITRRQIDQVLLGKAYFSTGDQDFILKNVEQSQPEVVAVGNSRVLQFRSEFFKDNIKFYNAGGGVDKIFSLNPFFDKLLLKHNPKVLIVGLEQNFFNEKWDEYNFVEGEGILEENTYFRNYNQKFNLFVNIGRQFLFDYFKHKFSLVSLFRPNKEMVYKPVGLNAVLRGNGKRNDGSYRYGARMTKPNDPDFEDYNFQDTLRRIESGNRLFDRGEDLSVQALAELELFCEKAKKENVHLVFFLPPYAPSIYEKLVSYPGNQYAFINKIPGVVDSVVDKFGFPLFDFTDPAVLHTADEEFVDGFHGSEKVYLKILQIMVKTDLILGEMVDRGNLRNLLIDFKGNLQVLD